MLNDFSQDRSQASSEWSKMQETIAQLRETGIVTPPKKEVAKKVEKQETKKEIPVKVEKEILVEAEKEILIKEVKEIVVPAAPLLATPMTLEDKVLNFINKHPQGVKISEMEGPLGETRMKLGYTAKTLLDEGRVQKIENIYFPLK